MDFREIVKEINQLIKHNKVQLAKPIEDRRFTCLRIRSYENCARMVADYLESKDLNVFGCEVIVKNNGTHSLNCCDSIDTNRLNIALVLEDSEVDEVRNLNREHSDYFAFTNSKHCLGTIVVSLHDGPFVCRAPEHLFFKVVEVRYDSPDQVIE